MKPPAFAIVVAVTFGADPEPQFEVGSAAEGVLEIEADLVVVATVADLFLQAVLYLSASGGYLPRHCPQG
jgi:hypothetical protein